MRHFRTQYCMQFFACLACPTPLWQDVTITREGTYSLGPHSLQHPEENPVLRDTWFHNPSHLRWPRLPDASFLCATKKEEEAPNETLPWLWLRDTSRSRDVKLLGGGGGGYVCLACKYFHNNDSMKSSVLEEIFWPLWRPTQIIVLTLNMVPGLWGSHTGRVEGESRLDARTHGSEPSVHSRAHVGISEFQTLSMRSCGQLDFTAHAWGACPSLQHTFRGIPTFPSTSQQHFQAGR